MDCFGTDSESLELAIQLQHQELNLWEQRKKGKQREGEVADPDLAAELCRHELETLATLVQDRILSLSIARAVDSDSRVIAEAKAAEARAPRDRELALELSRNPNAKIAPADSPKRKDGQHVDRVDDAMIESFRSMNLSTPTATHRDSDEEH